MRNILRFVILVPVVLVVSEARAACEPGIVLENATGEWLINSAAGEAFSGWFEPAANSEEKARVSVTNVEGMLTVGTSDSLAVTDITILDGAAKPLDGNWCGFMLGEQPARLGHAKNGLWYLQIGETEGNRLELIRR